MKVKRILKRIVFHTQKKLILTIAYFNHRLYMKFYVPLLEKQGMKFNGTPRYIGAHVEFDDFNLITLGERVVVSDHSHFLTHDYSITTAEIARGVIPKNDIALVRGIEVGDNVFIGKKSIIMPNTKIGNNIIIGAGAVVRGRIPDDSIVVGNPGVVVGKLSEQAEKWKKYMDSEYIRKD
ncbi:acyltransferase [Sphingobacterium detergens]